MAGKVPILIEFMFLQQSCWIELSVMMEIFFTMLFRMGTIRQMWLWITWNVASVKEDQNFELYLILLKLAHMSSDYHANAILED